MGTEQKSKSTRARKARSAKSAPRPRTKGGITKPPARKPSPRIPAAVEIAIDAQRDALGTALSLAYCLHTALRLELEDRPLESEALEEAAESADVTEVTAMLLVRLDAIHKALDSVELVQANPDPERVALAEAARRIMAEDSQP